MVKCQNCGNDLKYIETQDTEMGDGFYYEYNIEQCSECKLQYSTVIQYDLVERDHFVIDQIIGEDGK